MIDETSVHNEDENESTASEPEVKKAEGEAAELDPFFATGHFSIHHQPDHDDETYIGE